MRENELTENSNTNVDEQLTLLLLSSQEQTINAAVCNYKDSFQLSNILAELFNTDTDIDMHRNVTLSILIALKYHKLDKKVLLKAVSKHIHSVGTQFYEHAVLVVASLFEDSSFNLSGFTNLEMFKEHMPSGCFTKQEQVSIKTTFDDKTKIINDLSVFSKQNLIRHLQEAINVIKNETKEKLDEAFDMLPHLIRKASNRLITSKCVEYYDVIMYFDGYQMLKCDALYALVDRSFYILVDKVLDSIFTQNMSLRCKVQATNILVQVIDNDISKNKTVHILKGIELRLNKHDGVLHDIVQMNLQYLTAKCLT